MCSLVVGLLLPPRMLTCTHYVNGVPAFRFDEAAGWRGRVEVSWVGSTGKLPERTSVNAIQV